MADTFILQFHEVIVLMIDQASDSCLICDPLLFNSVSEILLGRMFQFHFSSLQETFSHNIYHKYTTTVLIIL